MTIATATISGPLLLPDITHGSKMVVTLEAYADAAMVTVGGAVIGGKVGVPIKDDGTASVTIAKIPQAGMLPSSGVQWHAIVKVGGAVRHYFFTLTADTTWDAVLTPANALAPPTLLGDVILARDAAVAAVAAVKIGTWQPTTAYSVGQTVQAPDGSLIKSLSSRTSRASFDATEAAFWRPAFNTYFPEAFGAVGNGVADDTAAINAAFAAASNAAGKATVVCDGTYKTTGSLFYWGDTDVVGSGKLICAAGALPGLDYWINAGISAKAVNATPWTGTWALDFVSDSAAARVGRHHQIHRAIDVTVSCTADLRPMGNAPANAFGTVNDATWCTTPTRTRLRYYKVIVLAAQYNTELGGEGISVSATQGLWIDKCWIEGTGDDPIALHGVTDFWITDNWSTSRDSRIAVFDSQRGTIMGNHHERVRNPDNSISSGGALMILDFEQPYPTGVGACADIDIRDNRLVHLNGYTAITYGIRLVGVRRVTVEDNRIQTYTNGKAITWEGVDRTSLSWVDPEGLDVDGKARIRSLMVRRNVVDGIGTTSGIIDEAIVFTGHMIAGTCGIADNFPGPDGVLLHSPNAYIDLPVFVRQVQPSAGGVAYATLVASTETPLQFPSFPPEDVPGGSWDIGNNRWNVPVKGLYEVTVSSRMTDAAAVRNVQLGVRLGSEGSMPPNAYIWRNQGGNRDVMTVTRVANVAAGDTIQGRIYSDSATYPLMEASMTIRRIG